MSPLYKHALTCIQPKQIESSIKGTMEGKEDSFPK